MRTVVQRVQRASVTVDGERIAGIGPGLLALVGIAEGDTAQTVDQLADKIALLRIFPNEAGKFDRSVLDIAGAVLVVSQFTLIADTSRGQRPSFVAAARPELAEPLIDRLVQTLRQRGVPVQTGKFGAHMAVELVNDGPVTIVLES